MIVGRIALLSKEEELLHVRSYDGIKNRNEIIKAWKYLYGKKYNECMIQIAPKTDEDRVDENGTNSKKRHTHRLSNGRYAKYQNTYTLSKNI